MKSIPTSLPKAEQVLLKLLTVGLKCKNIKLFLSSKALFQRQIPWKFTSVVHFIVYYVDPALVINRFCFVLLFD